MDELVQDRIAQAVALIQAAKNTVALTGAGISTPSGIPDFRSSGNGLWEKFNPLEVASVSAFYKRPNKFFDWLRPLSKTIFDAQPNSAHIALAEMQQKGYVKSIITQNIDNLHQRAGATSVIELHGSIHTCTCVVCQRQYETNQFLMDFIEHQQIPRCPSCSNILKPDIVLYEEMLPANAWETAVAICNQADLLIVIGTSLEVSPANILPEYVIANRVPLIINNLNPTQLDSYAALTLPYDVIEVLPEIYRRLT